MEVAIDSAPATRRLTRRDTCTAPVLGAPKNVDLKQRMSVGKYLRWLSVAEKYMGCISLDGSPPLATPKEAPTNSTARSDTWAGREAIHVNGGVIG